MRGLIFTDDVQSIEGNRTRIQSGLNPERLKNSLLYWDKISYISTPNVYNSMAINLNLFGDKDYGKEVRILQQENIISNFLLLTETEIEEAKKFGLGVPPIIHPYKTVRYKPYLIEGEIEGIGVNIGSVTEIGNGVTIGSNMRVKELYINLLMMQAVLAQDLNKKRDGFWSIGQTGSNFEMPLIQGISKESRLLELNFHNLLPFPEPDTPIEKILEFKRKYSPELLTFQLAWSKLITKIESSQGDFRIIQDCKNEIEVALRNLHRTLDENKIQKILGVVKNLLDIKQIGAAPIIAGAVAHLADVPIVIGALTGYAVSGAISLISKKENKIEKLDNRIKDYAYLYYVDKKLKN